MCPDLVCSVCSGPDKERQAGSKGGRGPGLGHLSCEGQRLRVWQRSSGPERGGEGVRGDRPLTQMCCRSLLLTG